MSSCCLPLINGPFSGHLQVPVGWCRQPSATLDTFKNMRKAADADTWYTARQTVDQLGGQVTEGTVKEYCIKGTLKAKKVGPKNRWMILGSSINALWRKWGLD
jgi:hypothetical protein